MKRSLQGKLVFSYLVVALLTVLVVSALIWYASGNSLKNLVAEQQTAQLAQIVQDYYTANGSLSGFFNDYMAFNRENTRPSQPSDNPRRPPPNQEVRGINGLVDAEYRAVLPTLKYAVGQTVPQEVIKHEVAVEVDGETIAWILPDTSFQFDLSVEEQLFLQRSTVAIGLAAVVGVLAALAMGFFLAGRLLKPIRQLTAASKDLSHGNLGQQVPVTSEDELGQLTATFNQMSADLLRADQERKRLTADITHDLSTPLQIIAGYVEMLEDDQVKLTPQRLEIIKTELEHLRRLVGDLTILSQVEAGGVEIQSLPVAPAELLERVFQAYEPMASREDIELTLDCSPAVPDILVDEGRMVQVLKNLLENALRHTPQSGTIRLEASGSDTVQLRVIDSGSGIDAKDLPYVFDRFYRADEARGANAGKMGLGLAICRALVDAQGGTISAQSPGEGGGTTVLMEFPAA